MDILISVIIPTYKDNERLFRCLESVNNQTLSKELFEVIVVNNDYKNEISLNSKYDFKVSIISESTPGSYASRNKGIENSKGKILAFTDSDCVVSPDWLSTAYDYYIKGNNDLIGGPIGLFSETGLAQLNCIEIIEQITAFPQRQYIEELNFSVTANLFVRKEVINHVGCFNSELKSGGDKEFCNRAVSLGFKIKYLPNLIVKHPLRNSFENILTKNKRVLGGIIKKEQSNYIKILYVLKSLMPKPFILHKIITYPNLSILKKSKVVFVYIKLKLYTFVEGLQLIFYLKNAIR